MNAFRLLIGLLTTTSFLIAAQGAAAQSGITERPSRHTVTETVERIEATASGRGLKVFARIDHSGEAEKAGLRMPPTQLIILGSPKAGTPVMLSAPSSAIDLPLKVLVRQTTNGQTVVAFNDPAWLQSRHSIPAEMLKPLSGLAALLAAALD